MTKTGRRREYPYYKVQAYDGVKLCWVDHRKAGFDSLEEARRYIKEELASRPSRILVVDQYGRHVL